MYCVIQEIETKKFNQYGHYKELVESETTITTASQSLVHYSYRYGDERFHRPIRKAYKVSIHQSKRVKGVVTKEQYAVTTANYYDLAEYWIGDCLNERRLKDIANKLNVSFDDVWNAILKKTNPLEERIKAEFHQSEEYRTSEEYQRLISTHSKKRIEFAKQYGCEPSEYEYCYDFYGKLRNPSYLEKVQHEYKYRKEYEEKSRSYQQSYYSNYNSYTQSSYSDISSSTYKENKDIYKKFYRTLSKTFHPDSNPDQDTSEEMKLLNQLKDTWGV